MSIQIQNVVDGVLKLGSIAGLIAIIYQIHNNRKQRPRLSFTFENSFAEFYKQDNLEFCDYHFSGIFRNSSLTPNTIVRLFLTVWDSKKSNSVLRFGHTVKQVLNQNTSNEVKLPLRLEAKQAYRLEIIFNFPLTGSQDKKILEAKLPTKLNGVDVLSPKHQYVFLIEDVAGNYFDYNSGLMSRELIDMQWLLSNHAKNPKRYFFEVFKIGWKYICWKVEKFISAIGFYK